MMVTSVLSAFRFLIVATLLIALASVSYAHRFHVADIDDELLQYLEAGGSLADICSDIEEGDTTGSEHCEAWRLLLNL